jgi:hypothetical protein
MFLNFVGATALSSNVTFTRGSNATLVDSTGKITYAPANLLLQSQTFDAAAWTKGDATISANATPAPDGTSTADKLEETTANAPHYALQAVTVASAVYTASVYVKAAERTWCILEMGGTPFGCGAWFNLSTGAVGTQFGSPSSTSITAVGNGWWRITVTKTAASAGSAFTTIYSSTGNNISTYAGTTGSGIFIWGAQLEPVTYQTTPSTYVATTSAAYYGPRFDYDPVTLAAKGLLIEEQRTNLSLQSEDLTSASWTKGFSTATANTATSPAGTTTADRWQPTSTGVANTIRLIQIISVSSGAAYTASAFVKAAGKRWVYFTSPDAASAAHNCWFDLQTGTIGTKGAAVTATITPAGDGWYRLTTSSTSSSVLNYVLISATDADNSLAVTADGNGLLIWGAQLEAGAFATSYIPTVASQVTRSADVATMTGTNFSSWYNQSEGTFVASASTLKPPSVATANFIAIASDGTQNERVQNVIDTSNVTAGVIDGNVSQANFTNAYTLNQILNSAIAYKVNDFAASFNGGTATTDVSGTIPTVNRMSLGSSWDGANFFLNGHIRQIAYYNTRLPNATLQALTA